MKKRLTTILLAWQEQFKDDASMSVFAGLYARFKKGFQHELHYYLGQGGPEQWRENEKKKEEQEGEKKGKEIRKEQGGSGERRRRPFNFERVCRLCSDRVRN